MPDIDSNAYKALKKISKHPDSRCLTVKESYWNNYLHVRGYTTSSLVEIAPKNGLSVEVITQLGRSIITDHRKELFCRVFKYIIIPIIVGVAIVLLSQLLLPLLQQPSLSSMPPNQP